MTALDAKPAPRSTPLSQINQPPHPPIAMVVTDLDGTIVQRDLTISPRVEAALRAVNEKTNVKLVIATGRMYPSAVRYAQRLGLNTPVICYQGAMTRESVAENGSVTQVLSEHPVPLALGQQVLAYCQAHHLHLNAYVKDTLYCENNPRFVAEYAQTSSVVPVLVDDLTSVLSQHASTKLVIIHDEMPRLQAAMAWLEATFGVKDSPEALLTQAKLTWCKSRSHFLEVTAPGISKWTAVAELAQRWEIAPEAILCLGDEDNDRQMLAHAGWGVALGNAPASVQALARVVAPSIDEDGAALALEQLVLKPNGVAL